MATAKTAKPKASFIPESKEAVMKKDLLDALDPKRKKGFQNATKRSRDDWVSPDGVWAYHMGYHQYTMDPELTTTNQNMKCILQMQDDPWDKQYDYSRIAVGNESMCVYEPRELLKETDNIQNLMDASTLASIEEILEETQDLDWLGIGNLVAESNMNPDGRFGGYADVSGEWMILESSPELILAMSPGCLNVKRKKYLVYNFMIFCSGTRNVWLGQYFLAAKEMHPIIEEFIINRLFSIRKIPEGFNEDTPFLIEAELPLSGNIFEHYKEVLCDPSGDKVDPSARLTPLRALYEKSENASPDDIDKLYEKLPPYQLYEDAEKIVAALDRCGCADAAAASHGEIKNIRSLHILRSLTFSTAALARLQKKGMDSFTYSIRVKEEKQFIDDFCVELAKAINCPSIDPLRPLLKYDPQNDDWSGYDEDFDEEEEDAIPDTLDDYDRLLKVIFEARNALIKIVEENSTFILEPISNVATEVEEEAFHPLQYIPRLRQLMLEDYDPIFGKTPDEFLTVFSEAVYQLSFFIMALPTYDDWIYRCPQENLPHFRQLLDEYKLQTLKAYIDDWAESLHQELDKAYQEQRLDMLSVFQRMDKILKD